MTLRSLLAFFAMVVVCSPAYAQRHTERGALLGGLSGALLGAALGDNNGEGAEGALIGGAIGLFSGAVLGSSVDREEAHWQARQNYHRSVQRAQAVSMTDVVQMTQTGLSDHVIMNQIRQRGVQRKIIVPDVIYLHQHGVSDAVITTMQQSPVAATFAVRHQPAPPPVIIERHHYVAPAPYWPRHYYSPHSHYRGNSPRPGVHFGISVRN
jgi:outer membrane lipoprotein SlyB